MSYSDTTIVLPTLNEEGNIKGMLSLLGKLYPGARIIVSDDGSKDKTQQIVKKFKGNVKLLDRSKKEHGITASVLDALGITKTGFMVVMDADFQHSPEEITNIIRMLRKGSNIVVASRRTTPKEWPLQRKIISKGALFLAKRRLNVNCKDPISGFFGIRTDFFKKILSGNKKRFVDENYKVLFDILKCLPPGHTIGEIYYDLRLRKKDVSKLNRSHVKAFLKSLSA